MPSSLLTASQARWALDLLVGTLSGVAIASSAPSAAGGAEMYSGRPGDIRGLIVILGSTGLIGVAVLRTASLLLPRPWRVYIDRLEFTLVSMLWICWTSATMAFSAFTLEQGVCSPTFPEFLLPTCPLLTFDLTLLHLLSTATLALLLVILSAALSPSYYLSMSPSSTSLSESQGISGGAGKGGISQGFVMWELALASPPSSPYLGPSSISTPPTASISTSIKGGRGAIRSYGTPAPTNPLIATSSAYPQLGPGNEESYLTMPGSSAVTTDAVRQSTDMPSPPKKRDKFAEGRVGTYIPLAICSLGVACASIIGIKVGQFAVSGIFIFVVAVLSLLFAIGCIGIHFSQKNIKITDQERRSHLLRHDRAIEVACAVALFVLWPLAAVIYTLFPSTPNRPCSNPAQSAAPPSPGEDLEETIALCYLSWTVVTLSWTASWLMLGRVVGLIFPMPEVDKVTPVLVSTTPAADEEERRSLLRPPTTRNPYEGGVEGVGTSSRSQGPGKRPQVGWGRIVAGEAFELGDADDDGDDDDIE
ncbi:hypothetical protein IAR55_005388 [Kwoniella newhampshirensis]|uniref:MARVEL domain-containing protein n=1 Tax=Kwoniella newhampshirensis TaxID=1651941 RepID=A0AAW0YHB5_9TREE